MGTDSCICGKTVPGVGFATYDCATGAPLESGQISKQNLPPDGRNAIPAARNWYLFELSDDDRKAIQQESVKILEKHPAGGHRQAAHLGAGNAAE